ncbi:MAG: ABC transporter permease subunit [Clostridiales bacterium]|nr:ABC transporter permease subunit [Clostridiales bacterium]
MVAKVIKRIYVFLIFVFLHAPIAMLIIFSFNNSKSRAHWDGFTLKWYARLLTDQAILRSLYITIVLAILASIIATIFGTIAAIGIYKMRSLAAVIVTNLTYVPILNPDIVTGISLMLLFISIKFPLGFFSLLISHITFSLPFVIISVLPKLRELNPQLLDAALDLGASPAYAYRNVILPQISQGIVTGFLLSFTMSIDDFVISFFNTGAGISNLAITIYSMARRGINPKINALLTLVFTTVILLTLVVNSRMSEKMGDER